MGRSSVDAKLWPNSSRFGFGSRHFAIRLNFPNIWYTFLAAFERLHSIKLKFAAYVMHDSFAALSFRGP